MEKRNLSEVQEVCMFMGLSAEVFSSTGTRTEAVESNVEHRAVV